MTRLQPESMAIGQAAGALAAIAVREGVEPRMVHPETVQRALLKFNVTLARQDLPDLPRNVDAWRAAEYALVREWLPEQAGGFAPGESLSRADASEALAVAFSLLSANTELDRRWGYAPAAEATFKDVPLYSKHSAAVEALAAAHALQPCGRGVGLFCPDAVEYLVDFNASIAALKNGKAGAEESAARAHSAPAGNGVAEGKDAQPECPLTRIKAAELLYEALQP